MPRHLIAHLADTQLDKRLYGLEDTRQDWFRALELAFSQLFEQREHLAAISILGDILDTEAVGSEAAYALQKAVGQFRNEPIPILLILGNHDANPQRDINWARVCQLINPHVVALDFSAPFTIPAEGELPPICVLGNDHLSRNRMETALKELVQPVCEGKVWMFLHQALAELAPHKDAWDVRAPQVPDWVNRVFLGDFHNHCAYRDPRGIEFVYPGAIETVSFNQTEKPGYLLYDRRDDSYTHISTQQREYLSFTLSDIPRDQWGSHLKAAIEASTRGNSGRKPVVRVFYPAFEWEAWQSVMHEITPLCLKFFDYSEDEEPTETVTLEIEEVPDSREEIKELGCKILDATADEIAEAAKRILINPEAIQDIKNELFPKAITRPS